MRTFRENGILSVDFLIGFSIFLLALIMILTMIPGIFAGLDSAQIDYDAVAYRTSVILCEDPGWPADDDSWEFMDTYHKDDIDRLGLAVSSTSPNILSKEKRKLSSMKMRIWSSTTTIITQRFSSVKSPIITISH